MTRERVERFRRERTSDGWATTLDVTDPVTWAYRGSNYPDGAVELTTNGRLLSKAQRRQIKRPDPDFYSDHGPKVFARATRNNVDLTLQMIATSSSDVPASQYVSIALIEAVASVFGPGKTFYPRTRARHSQVSATLGIFVAIEKIMHK